ncbi:hypothetical protein BJX61DRAFT_527104 [Aspergillus egyptiacus]|nr:hypothetical protein BJX61DRAFT_527104 [Aspergillus egyptiacus]
METAASVIAVVQLSTSIVTACNKYLNSVRHAAEEIRDLREGVEAYLATIQKLRELTASTNRDRLVDLGSLNDLIEKSETALREIETRLNGKSSNPMRRWGWRAMKWPFTKDEVNDTLKRLGQWRDTLSTALLADNFSQSLNIARALDRTEQSRYLEKLPRVAQAAFDSRSQQHDPHCLPGTRTEILQRLVSWSYDHDSEPICWLRGMAGTGKSTIARTVASLLHDEGCLGGSFFFSRSAGDRGHAGKLMSTLAVQLAKKDSQLKQGICDAVLEDEDISQRSLAEQCSRLIVHPLKKLNGSTAFPLVFVIDALDECDNEDDIELIPQLLTMIVDARTRYRVRILISARPERAVRRGFHQVESALHHELNLFDIDEAVVKSDISLLIGHELTKIRSRHGLPDSWPSFKDEVIDILSTRAGTLFIYAMTVCRFI